VFTKAGTPGEKQLETAEFSGKQRGEPTTFARKNF
jgi:hypothetical protein